MIACLTYLFAQTYSRTSIESLLRLERGDHSSSAALVKTKTEYYAAELYSSSSANIIYDIGTIITTEDQASDGTTTLSSTPVVFVDNPTTKKPSLCTRDEIQRGHWKGVQRENHPTYQMMVGKANVLKNKVREKVNGKSRYFRTGSGLLTMTTTKIMIVLSLHSILTDSVN